MDYDVIVLGGGPGGYTAAIRCSQYGLKTAIIEKDKLGGTCLNRGCIPTKAMLSSAELAAKINKANLFGIEINSDININMNTVIDRKDKIVAELVGGLDKLFDYRKIKIYREEGILSDKHTIILKSGEKITANNIIIATGSRPLELPFLNIDRQNVITSDQALQMREIPEEVLIIGGGVVGCEFGSMLNDFGSKVTIVEMLKQLLPTEDKQIAQTLKKEFTKKGINVKLKTKVEKITILENEKIEVSFSQGEKYIYKKVIASLGRSTNIENIGLDKINILLTENKRFIEINKKMQTNIPNIYAIGDITGKLQLAHTAATQGLVAAATIAGKEMSIDYSSIPAAIFTSPEIASIGASEQYLKDNGIEYHKSSFNFAANGKAKGLAEEIGFVKLLTDSNKEKILGAHIIGPHASDLLSEFSLVKTNNLDIEKIISTVHIHPTLGEAVLEATEAVHKMAIHSV